MWQYKGNFSKDQHVDKVIYNDDEDKEDNDVLLMTKSLTTNYEGAREVAMAWGKVVLLWQLDRRRLPSTYLRNTLTINCVNDPVIAISRSQ